MGSGKNGRGGQYWLYSGTFNSVNMKGILDGKSVIINHTHPGGTPFASKKDRELLEKIQKNGGLQQSSEIIVNGREKTTRFNKNG